MPDPTEEELARLRARAYGPDADLDEAGLARLFELEAALSPRGPSAARTPEPEPEAEPGPVPQPAAAEEPPPADEPEPLPLIAPVSLSAAPTPRTLDRRLRVAWVLSILVVAAVAAGLTAWTLPWGVRDDQQHAARLTEQPGELPAMTEWDIPGLDQDDLRSYGSYRGLEVYATDACIIVRAMMFDAGGSSSGTCTGAGLEPAIDFYVMRAPRAGEGGMRYPDETRARFPDGGVVRFTRNGDSILVDEGALPPGF
ncbi:hypothetical protein [Microbacterium binotii]|uniref:DUF306 domain-containing protein n=1 Tax=Microbacterium binotii TaxID=462710 RepID=A0ABN3P644_9MICO